MSRRPYMPLFVADYLGDTANLTLKEHGAYLLLLMAMWRHGGSIPDDDRDNARMLKMDVRAFPKMKRRLMPFFEVYGPVDNRRITQKRLQKEWNYVQGLSRIQSEKGKRSQAIQRERKQILSDLNGSTPVATERQPNLNRTSTPNLQSKKDRIVEADRAAVVAASPDGAASPPSDEIPERIAALLKTPLMRKHTR